MKNKFIKEFNFWFYLIMLIILDTFWPLFIAIHVDVAIGQKIMLSMLMDFIFTFMLTFFIVQYYLGFKSWIRWIIKTEQGYFMGVEEDNARVSDNRYAAKLLDKYQLELYLEMFEKAYPDCKIEVEEIPIKEEKKWKK